MNKKALITGITGQDCSYLSESFLDKGYEMHGLKRRSDSLNTERADQVYQALYLDNPNFILHVGICSSYA